MAITIAAVIGAAGAYASAEEQADAAEQAAEAQSLTAMQNVMAQEKEMQRQQEMVKPWREAGMEALSMMREGIRSGEFGADSFKFDYDNWQDPGYQFRLQEGYKALENKALARGMVQSGAQQKALMRYGQDMASQEYGAAFDRALRAHEVKQQGFNQLAKMAGYGTDAIRQDIASGTAGINAMAGERSFGAQAQAEADITRGAARASSYRALADVASQYAKNSLYKDALKEPGPAPPQTR